MDYIEQQMRRAQRIKNKHEDALMARPGVLAVGLGLRNQPQGQGEEVTIVLTVERIRGAREAIFPADIEGVPIDVQYSNSITAD